MSECLRCGRDLKDPYALFGWRCAEKLGVPTRADSETTLLQLLAAMYLEDLEDGSLSRKNAWMGDLFTGLAPFSGKMKLLPNNIIIDDKYKYGLKQNFLFDKNTNTRLWEFDYHPLSKKLLKKNGLPKSMRNVNIPHINVEVPSNANAFQKQLAKSLDHKRIPRSVYDSFRDFDKVKKIAKKGGKAMAVAGAVVDAVDLGTTMYDDYQDDGQFGKATASSAARIGGSWAGAWAGAKGGAALGTLVGSVFPGVGNVVGGFIGGVVGGIAGSLLGGWAGEEIVDATIKD